MTATTTEYDPIQRHDEVWQLLPWYANQSLDDHEKAIVAAHLDDCLTCRRELVDLENLRSDLQDATWSEDQLERSLAKMNGILDRETASPVANQPGLLVQGWRQLRAIWEDTSGGMRFVVGAQAAALALALVWIGAGPTSPNEAAFVTLEEAEGEAATGLIRMQVAGGIGEAELRSLLLEVKAEIVAGPTQTGVYTLRPAAAQLDRDDIALELDTSSIILFATPVGEP